MILGGSEVRFTFETFLKLHNIKQIDTKVNGTHQNDYIGHSASLQSLTV